jgi:hypothetical protein
MLGPMRAMTTMAERGAGARTAAAGPSRGVEASGATLQLLARRGARSETRWQAAGALQQTAGNQAVARRMAAAERGTAGGRSALPHAAEIQSAFGGHDVASIAAFTGGAARQACEALGARAYAAGERVAFAEAPDLHTAAHEAAHVVQQRAGVRPPGGVGAPGDAYERHAEAVASRVTAGRSAEDLLAPYAARASGQAGGGVQLLADEYEFAGAEIEELKLGGTVLKVTTDDGTIVAKQPDGGDLTYNELARAVGFNAPETRGITDGEVEALKAAGYRANNRWVVMEFKTGTTLLAHGAGRNQVDDGGFGFTMQTGNGRAQLEDAQLRQLGKSLAFQIFMKGWDRWELPVGTAKGQYNFENIMVEDSGEIALIDNTGISRLGLAEEWQQDIGVYVDELLAHNGEGELLDMAARRLGQTAFAIDAPERRQLRAGFVEFLRVIDQIDLSALAVGEATDDMMTFWEDMQAYFREKLEEFAPEEDQRQQLRAHFERYRQGDHWRMSKRKRAKRRIKEMRKALPRGQRRRFDAIARDELATAFPR